MTTELDVYALKQLAPLQCAEQLARLSTQELKAICNYLALRYTRKAEKTDLVGTITLFLHPSSSTPAATADVQQMQLF